MDTDESVELTDFSWTRNPGVCQVNFLAVSSCDAFEAKSHNVQVLLTPWPDDIGLWVSCDLDTDGGGWTVIQRRQKGTVDFSRNWDEYKSGFGTVSGEFWLGLENIRRLVASNADFEIRFDMTTMDGAKHNAVYEYFTIAAEDDLYRLRVKCYSGTAGDSFSELNGAVFSSPDKDGTLDEHKCASVQYSSGFWFTDCLATNPNGNYQSVFWKTLDAGRRLPFFEMKIRPRVTRDDDGNGAIACVDRGQNGNDVSQNPLEDDSTTSGKTNEPLTNGVTDNTNTMDDTSTTNGKTNEPLTNEGTDNTTPLVRTIASNGGSNGVRLGEE